MLLILRLIGMAAAGVAGWQLGLTLAGFPNGTVAGGEPLRYVLVLALAGGALGLLLTPYATIVPLRWLWGVARSVAATDLIGATLGLLTGLLIATLASFPISLLPDPLGRWLPFAAAVLFAWLGMSVGAVRKDEILRSLRGLWRGEGRAGAGSGDTGGGSRGQILLDTSALIDGRIVEVCLSGFVAGDLAVPAFVLEELQLLADSPDPTRRQRGRRGLNMVERLQRESTVEIVDADYPEVHGVDGKLIRLARQRRAAIVTTDYNLNRVASLQGVLVLNVNDLANALRSVVVPGEDLSIEIVQEGRERNQGVGYLEDGTMVVVEGGRRLVGSRAEVEVTRLLPTTGGRLVFARLKLPTEAADVPSPPPAPARAALRVVRNDHAGDA